MATNTEKIVVQVVVKGQDDLKKLEQNSQKANSNVTVLTGGVGKLTKGIGAMKLGLLAAVTAFVAVNKALVRATKTFRDFEFQMSKVKAITGANDKDFKRLSNTAQELGRSTFFTAQQVAELQTNFGKLGFTTKEILDAQKATLDLATATGSDLARAATVAGAAVRGFGLDANETQRVVDVMAVSFTSSAMDIEKFQTSMTKVAPIAKAAGFSIEDTTAIMSQLTDAGIEASIAGTSLRNILLKMQDPNSDLVKSFGKTIHSLDELVPALTKFSEEGGDLAQIMEVVDLRQAAAFEQMITSKDATVSLRDAMINANGAASEMAEIVGDNLQGAFLRLTSAWQGLQIVITESFLGRGYQAFIDNLAEIINKITFFVEGYDSLNDKIVQTAKSHLEEKKRTEELITEYARLDSIVDKTKEEKTKFNLVTTELEENIGDSIKIINKETGALVLNSQALDAAIARHALLADDEAVKLVNQLNKLKKQIDDNTKALGDNNSVIQQNQDLLDEKSKTDADNYVNTQQQANAIKMLNAEGQIQENVTSKVIAKTQEQIDLENKINTLQQKNIPLKNQNNQLNEERAVLLEQLNSLGYTQEDIANLQKNSLDEINTKLDENTKATKANTEEKNLNKLIDEEILNFRFNLLQQGLLNDIEADKVRKDLHKAEMNRIREQLENMELSVEERMALIQRYNDLEIKLSEKSQAQKDKEFKEDIAHAALRGQSAIESMKSVVRARAMEAVAEEIVQIMKKVPFPFNLVVAGGIGYVISSLFDQALAQIPNTFAKGGMIEEYAHGGMVHGKSHAQGGEKFAVGGRVVELEGGEAVINKRSTSMFRNQLSAMNVAGGGVKFADGGLMNMPSFAQSQFNATSQAGMMGAIGQGSKVVVVESDISQVQNTVSVIEAEATF
jgi:TP901 family phage tail tape measure protein